MIKKIRLFISNKELIYLLFIIGLILISSLVELVGVASIPVFLGVILNPKKILEYSPDNFKNFINYDYINQDIIVIFAFILLFVFVIKNLYLFFVNYIQANFFRNLRIRNSDKLLKYFFSFSYIFFISTDPSYLLRTLSSDLDNANTYLEANLNIIRETLLVILIFVLLLFVSGSIVLLAFFGIGFLSFLIYYFFKKKLTALAKINFIERAEHIKITNQIFYNIQDIKILIKENFFLKKFNKIVFNIKKTDFFNQVFSKSPRLIFETAAVMSMVIIIIFYSHKQQDIKEILPLLSLLGVSALRLIPSFNIITLGFAVIKKSEISFNSVSSILAESRKNLNTNFDNKFKNRNNISVNEIEIKNLSFKYPATEKMILKNINLKIQKNSSIGIVGKTGDGKSTLIKLISGLLNPSNGKILVNGKDIHEDIQLWYNNISYVPQSMHLINDTIRKNIALGEDDQEIDNKKIINSIKLSGLENFIKNLPNSYETYVGADGLKLSGGQIQRICIARAIYLRPSVFILDEATSSLDQKTEREILNDFNKLKFDKILIMVSHRLASLKHCDKVFYISNGEIKDSGNIEDLIKRNPQLIN